MIHFNPSKGAVIYYREGGGGPGGRATQWENRESEELGTSH